MTDKSIVLDGTQIKCLTTSYNPCTISIHLKGNTTSIELKNGSKIQGKQVIIQAPDSEVRIYDSSNLWVSGQSTNTNGTQNPFDQAGASFIGSGGNLHKCSITDAKGEANQTTVVKDKTYGEFDMVPSDTHLSKIYS